MSPRLAPRLVVLFLAVALAGSGCGEPTDPAPDAGPTMDSGLTDGGLEDSGRDDSGDGDSGRSDSGASDAGPDDSGTSDAGPDDSGAADSGDAGVACSGDVECGDGVECTVDRCVADACVHGVRDDDSDGHAPLACAGDDCADDDGARYPGAAEICGDAIDQDCDDEVDDGCCTPDACVTTCGSAGTTACPTGACTAPAESCNGADDDCDGACDNGFACCRGETRDCSTLGFHAGAAVCRGDCGSFDTSACTDCGDGALDAGEICDGADLGGASCTSIGMGFGGGSLRCATGCVLDTSMCSRCGNGTVDPGEACDGADLGGATCASVGTGFESGTIRCSPSCGYDTTSCAPFSPVGTYSLSPTPAYSCAFGAVGFSVPTMSLSLSGSTMTAASGLPCSPSGTYQSATRSFELTCTGPGTCVETYRVVGSFTGPSTWSGTVTATYVGSCFGCANQSWSVAGTR